MLIWLDGDTNTKAKPQENFGRELMELFSRGVGFYTEDDVYAAARVFTGMEPEPDPGRGPAGSGLVLQLRLQREPARDDREDLQLPDLRGRQPYDPVARPASSGMQDGLDLINALSTHPETASRLMTKLYAFFVSETATPDPAFINQLAAVYLQNDTAIAPVLQFLLTSPQFQDESIYFTRYSWPAEFVVRSIKEIGWTGFSAGSVLSPLDNMGQELLEPPNVAGWSLGQRWFSTGAMLARMNFASTLAANQKFKLATAVAASGRESSRRRSVDFLLTRLTPSTLDAATYGDLAIYAAAGAPWTSSDTQRQTKASGLAHLIVGSPAYQVL